MNEQLSVLILMEDFAPVNNCGTIPNTKLVKYLARLNLDITLMISELTGTMDVDEKLVPKELNQIRVIRIPYGSLFKRTLGSARAKASKSGTLLKMKAEKRPLREWLVSAVKTVYLNIRSFDYMHNGKKVIRKYLMQSEFDIVYSTYPSKQPHKLAQYVMKNKLGKKWVADFRDPMAYDSFDSKGFNKAMRKQHRIERKADHITVVSNGALSKFLFSDISTNKLTVIPNGYDPEDVVTHPVEDVINKDKLRIFYAGTLYAGKRGLDAVFRAVSELSGEKLLDLNNLSLEYAGKEWPVFRKFAAKYGLESICSDYGFIPRSRVMEILSQIDCSMVCSNNTIKDRGVVTGKVFELLVVGKPIITIIAGDLAGSELANIIHDCNAGIVYEEANDSEDFKSLKDWLLSVYREKMNTGRVESHLIPEKRAVYSYDRIAECLCEVFNTVSVEGI